MASHLQHGPPLLSAVRLLPRSSPTGCRRRTGLLASRQSDNRFFTLFRRVTTATSASSRRRASRATSTASAGRRPAIACRSILNEVCIRADSVASSILLTGVPVILAIFQCSIVDLDDRILVAGVVLRPTRETRQMSRDSQKSFRIQTSTCRLRKPLQKKFSGNKASSM